MRFAIRIVAVLALVWAHAATAQHVPLPEGVPLVDDDDWELVYAHCSACHSLSLVVAQRGDRDTWLRLIRWMQDTQNLWTFDPGVEERILDYLARNYPPQTWTRRAPLPERLLPPKR